MDKLFHAIWCNFPQDVILYSIMFKDIPWNLNIFIQENTFAACVKFQPFFPTTFHQNMPLFEFLTSQGQGSPFPTARRPGVKLPVGQVYLNRIFLFISYKQIKEFQNSWSRASDDFEKRQALKDQKFF